MSAYVFNRGDIAVVSAINRYGNPLHHAGRQVRIHSGPDDDRDYSVFLVGDDSEPTFYVQEDYLTPADLASEELAEAPEGFVAKKDVYRMVMAMAVRHNQCDVVEDVLEKLSCMPVQGPAESMPVGTVFFYHHPSTEEVRIAVKVKENDWEITEVHAVSKRGRIRSEYDFKIPHDDADVNKIRFRTILFQPSVESTGDTTEPTPKSATA